MTDRVELYGAAGCPYTAELRQQLQWEGTDFVEYDVEADPDALTRLLQLTGESRMVPVLAKGGRVIRIGWQGRGCRV